MPRAAVVATVSVCCMAMLLALGVVVVIRLRATRSAAAQNKGMTDAAWAQAAAYARRLQAERNKRNNVREVKPDVKLSEGVQAPRIGAAPRFKQYNDMLLVGKIIKEMPAGNDSAQSACATACHNDIKCSHFEVKDKTCYLKDRSVALLDGYLGQEDPSWSAECGVNGKYKCADGIDRHRTLYMHPGAFNLYQDIKKDTGGLTSNEKIMDAVKNLFDEVYTTLNPPGMSFWDIFGIVLTFVTAALFPIGLVGGVVGAIATVTEIALSVGQVAGMMYTGVETKNRQKISAEKMDLLKSVSWTFPIMIFKNMDEEAKFKIQQSKQCRQNFGCIGADGTKMSSEEFRKTQRTADGKPFATALCSFISNCMPKNPGCIGNDVQKLWDRKYTTYDIPYADPDAKTKPLCCELLPEDEARKCRSAIDGGTCRDYKAGGKYVCAGARLWMNNSAWAKREPAPHNYSSLIMEWAERTGDIIS